MKQYYRIWLNKVILCMLAVFASACGEDEDIILRGEPWPGYPDRTQPILNIIVENENGENLLNPSTPGSWHPGVSWMSGSFSLVNMEGRKSEVCWEEYCNPPSHSHILNCNSAIQVRSLKLQTEPWQTWDVSLYSENDYSFAILAFCKRKRLPDFSYSFKTKFSLYVPMREEPFVFEITGKYNDSTRLYSDLKILMDSQEQESQLIHVVIPTRPPQP